MFAMLQTSVDVVKSLKPRLYYLNLRCLSTFRMTGQSRNGWYYELLSYKYCFLPWYELPCLARMKGKFISNDNYPYQRMLSSLFSDNFSKRTLTIKCTNNRRGVLNSMPKARGSLSWAFVCGDLAESTRFIDFLLGGM